MKTIDYPIAFSLAREKVESLARQSETRFAILEDKTKEIKTGWVFFFDSMEFIESGDISFALAGNAPIFITRAGKIFQLSSAFSWEQSIKELGYS